MKIKDVEIRLSQADISKVKAGAVVCRAGCVCQAKNIIFAPVADEKGEIGEESVRGACAHALALARLLGVKSLALPPLGSLSATFPAVASAKIMAQEIFRYIRQDRKVGDALGEIIIVLPSVKEFKIFKKTVFGYLRHIVDTLCWGPFVTVDTIIEAPGGIVLIKRSNPPFGWALPGGFVEAGESLEEAACREAREETGLLVSNLRQLHTYSAPWRDPRFHTITTVFICQAKGKPRASSDAAEARVFGLRGWERVKLAFDHRRVLEDYLCSKRNNLPRIDPST
jgi:8-oxo-dGTP diphosphatase